MKFALSSIEQISDDSLWMWQKKLAERNVSEPDNVRVHRAAANDKTLKAARPAAPCATYCYRASCGTSLAVCLASVLTVRARQHDCPLSSRANQGNSGRVCFEHVVCADGRQPIILAIPDVLRQAQRINLSRHFDQPNACEYKNHH